MATRPSREAAPPRPGLHAAGAAGGAVAADGRGAAGAAGAALGLAGGRRPRPEGRGVARELPMSPQVVASGGRPGGERLGPGLSPACAGTRSGAGRAPGPVPSWCLPEPVLA